MNKTELIAKIAEKTDYTKKATAEFLDAALDEIMHQLANGEKVTLPGFGTFEPAHRAARVGRNPQTGDAVDIAEAIRPVFKAGATFKAAVNS